MTLQTTITATTGAEPATTAEAKNYLKVDFASDDALIADAITAAREWCERYTGTTIVAQTLRATYTDLELESSDLYVTLPRGPLAALTSVVKYDNEGTTTTLPTADRYLLPNDTLRIVGVDTQAFAYEATYTTAPVGAVPAAFRSAIYMIVGDLYQTRSNSVIGTISAEVEMSAQRILAPYRRVIFFGQ